MSDGPGTSAGQAEGHHDALQALRNGVKLLGSLFLTWGIALGVRLLLPRFLGPDAFGPVNFADAFTAGFFVLLGFGLDVYIRKEVSVRPEHASDFFAGVILLRVLGTLLLFGVMQAVLVATDRPLETRLLVYVFALAQVFFTQNQSLAALLHARGTVSELAVLNIVSKVVWGAGVLATVVFRWPLWGIPFSLLVSELLKAAVNWRLVAKHLDVRWRFDLLAVKAAIVASLPMYLNTAAHTAYNKLDVSIIAVVAGDREVAWYGASSLLAGLTMMVAPMIGWVLMPLFARARARSDEEYVQVMRRSLEAVLALAFPTTLFLALGADVWIRLLYGEAYAPAAASLRILAPLFVLTYVAIISANSLIITGRAWAMALISISGLVVNPLLNWLCLPPAMRAFPQGGGGIGAATAQVGTEIFVTALMTYLVGARAFDRRTVVMVLKTLAVCGATVAVDRALAGFGPLRLAPDVAVYVLLIVLVRAVNLRETYAFARAAFKGRKRKEEAP